MSGGAHHTPVAGQKALPALRAPPPVFLIKHRLRQGRDTLDIAREVDVRESAIWNVLCRAEARA